MADLFDQAEGSPQADGSPAPEAAEAPDGAASSPLGNTRVPLAVRMRPASLEDVAGQDHALRKGSPLRLLIEADTRELPATSVILCGPPGTGKTTLARLISEAPGRRFASLSALSAGVKEVREAIAAARAANEHAGASTVLFLDEIHRFSKTQQDSLLQAVEDGWVTLVAATTENPTFSVVGPLLSRSLVVTLRPLTPEAVGEVLDRALASRRGLRGNFTLDPAAREALVARAGPDARKALTLLEASAAAAWHGGGGSLPVEVTPDDVDRSLDAAMVNYDRAGDHHYDVASAFIKSIRGSDVDAAMHYLARMLVAGEDPRFIARRLVISASEDVGMADPSALGAAVAAAQGVQLVGMPEGRIILAQAVAHLATAPKSNAAYLAVNAAMEDVRSGKGRGVPHHLRDGHSSADRGDGAVPGYLYPHDDPRAVSAQQYAPDDLVGVDYYRPKPVGAERDIAARLERLRGIVRGS